MKSAIWVLQFELLYIGIITIWFILWVVSADTFWWMALLNHVVPYLFSPVLLFIVLSLMQQNKRSFVYLLVPLIIFMSIYFPYFIPRWMEHESQVKLTVMTYNLLYSNLDYDGITHVIRTNQPDLIALQEVQPDTMLALQRQLRDQYPYSIMGSPNPYGTTAVFSRYAFVDSYILNLKVDRPAVVVKVRVGNEEITFASAHLLAFNLQRFPLREIPSRVAQLTNEQNIQAEILRQSLAKASNSVILGCDCNSKETASSYRILSRSLLNAARQIGWRVNQQNVTNKQQDRNIQHIDYVFYKGKLLYPIGVYKVRDAGGSDHLPVLAIFNVRQ